MDIEAISRSKLSLSLPVLSPDEVFLLCDSAKELFNSEDVSLQISGPVVIIGDLHGQILDLFRVIQTFGLPENHKFLFLGDIVDRGEFSTETCILVWSLKVKFPTTVFVIRGNHEFASLCRDCGFHTELTTIYGQASRVFDSFADSFSVMPITAIIGQKIICVHGGLGPGWYSLSQSRTIDRPIYEFGDDLLDSMLWSDPNPAIDFFEPSTRGTGYIFGGNAVTEFLDSNCLSLLVRAHECVNTGCQFLFDDRLVTVFGASNYGGLLSNNSAVLEVGQDGNWQSRQFLPLFYLKREHVKFGKLGPDGVITAAKVMRTERVPQQSVPRLPALGGPALKMTTARGAWGMTVKPPSATTSCRSPRRLV